MKLWNIVDNKEEISIEVGQKTILKGNDSRWYSLVRIIDDYFNNRKSEVLIYEDTQLINAKDWECLFIPYDAHISLEKVNSKSPLKTLLDEVCDTISMSPVYQELMDVWETLDEEMNLVQEKLNKYDLKLRLKQFELEDLKQFLTFHSLKKDLTPIQFKILLTSLFSEKVLEKKCLIILELPELFATREELLNLQLQMEKLERKGVQFIVTSQKLFEGNQNFFVNGKIINSTKIECVKRNVINELPFYCDDELFNTVKKELLFLVDNQVGYRDISNISTDNDEQFTSLLYVLDKIFGTGLNVDVSRLPVNVSAYLNKC